MSRILGVLAGVLTLVSGYLALESISWSWPWLGLVVWTIYLGLATVLGWEKIPVGWRAQLLGLGTRLPLFVREGWRWSPWPFFSFAAKDCRRKPEKLDTLITYTADNAEVELKDMSVVTRVTDVNAFLGVDSANFKILYDDIIDRNVKAKVALTDVETAVKTQFGTNNVQTIHDLVDYGVEIEMVIVPTVFPTDEKVRKGLQLEVAEKFERAGQLAEAEGQTALIAFYMKDDPGTGYKGMTPEQAREQAQLTIGQAKKNIFALDPAAIAAIMGALGRITP